MGWSDWIPKWLQKAPVPVQVETKLGTLTLAAYWMGRDAMYPAEWSYQVHDNAVELLRRVNLLLGQYGSTPAVNSGWRPASVNAAAGGAAHSLHLTGEAVDLADRDGALKYWCMSHLSILADCGLWMENGTATPTWCHLQSKPPASGRRVFQP